MKKLITIILILTIVITGAIGATYHVSPEGSDLNPGTVEQPFKTIVKALQMLRYNGGTCILHEGVYRTPISMKDYNRQTPIKIVAAPGERVVMDGREEITSEWIHHKGGIWKCTVTRDMEQVFFRDTMIVEARWPNMSFPDDLWDRNKWATTSNGSDNGLIVDPELLNTNIDWTGALAVMNLSHQFWTWTSPVTKHEPGSDRFEYDFDKLSGVQTSEDWDWPMNDDYYYLVGKLEALDFPGEWFYDRIESILYVYPPGGAMPDSAEVSVKREDYAFIFEDCRNIYLSGIHFFGCAFKFINSDYCVVENCDLMYPAYSREITDRYISEYMSTPPNASFSGTHNTARNCKLAYSCTKGISFSGNYNLAEGNYIHDVGWYGSSGHPALSMYDDGELGHNTARRNTLFNAGNIILHIQGYNTLVELNHVYNGGLACKDVSLVYTQLPLCAGTVIRYNWVHGVYTPGRDGTPDEGGLGIRGDDKTRQLYLHHNVIWDCGRDGIVAKGDQNRLYNNTGFENGYMMYVPNKSERDRAFDEQWPALPQSNQNSMIYNNLGGVMRGDLDSQDVHPGAPDALFEDNVETDGSGSLFRSVDNYDFRPKPNNLFVDAGRIEEDNPENYSGQAPDIGAYEYSDEYWIPGRKLDKSSVPIPLQGAKEMSMNRDLIFLNGYQAVSADIYFGTDSSAVANATDQSPEFLVNKPDLKNVINPADFGWELQPRTDYYWRVDAVKESGEREKGDVWQFTTGDQTYAMDFQVYESKKEQVIPSEKAKIDIQNSVLLTNSQGRSFEVLVPPFVTSSFTVHKKGFKEITGQVKINSDTTISDTLMQEFYNLKIQVRDKDTDELIKESELNFGGELLSEVSNGTYEINDLVYAFYDVELSADEYLPVVYSGIEIFSDTAIVLTVKRDYVTAVVQVTSKSSGLPLSRVVINYEGNVALTNSDGEATLDKLIRGKSVISFEQYEYFTYVDSFFIAQDTILEIELTAKLATAEIIVSDTSGPVVAASIAVGPYQLKTNTQGSALFYNKPTREEYVVQIEKEGYIPILDTIWFVVDTMLQYTLTLISDREEFETESIMIYPNPAKYRICLEGFFYPRNVELLDAMGRVCSKRIINYSPLELDISALEKGCYFIKIEKNHISYIKKVILE